MLYHSHVSLPLLSWKLLGLKLDCVLLIEFLEGKLIHLRVLVWHHKLLLPETMLQIGEILLVILVIGGWDVEPDPVFWALFIFVLCIVPYDFSMFLHIHSTLR